MGEEPRALSLIDPSHLPNPYPVYQRLRETDPVHWDETMAAGLWVVTRYADVAPALRDPRLSGNRMPLYRLFLRDTEEARAFDDGMSRSLLFLDPPRHTQLRALVSKAFTPRVVEHLRPRVEALTDALLDEAEQRGRVDIIRDLAIPLPVTVIAELLGIPPEERAPLKQWSADLARFIGQMRGIKRAMVSAEEFRTYLRSKLEERRAHPGSDLLSALVAAEDEGRTLSEADVLATCALLLNAGHETTTHLIGNGLLALLQHPDQLAALRDDPELMPGAIEELLRFDGTVQGIGRVALDDVEVGGKLVAAGQGMMLMVAAANRDPAEFPDPDRLDIRRRDVRHLSFGMGIHFCLGAPLARLEGAVALGKVLRRWPRLRLAGDTLDWQENPFFRGLKTLPVRM